MGFMVNIITLKYFIWF